MTERSLPKGCRRIQKRSEPKMKIVYVTIAAVALFIAAASPSLGQAPPLSKNTTNSSAVITTGNTFQTVLAAITNANQRRSLTIQNNNTTTDNCWVFVGAGSPTKGTSILLLPGGAYTRYFPYVPADAIQATCASNGNTLYIDRQQQ